MANDMNRDITSANAELVLAVDGVFPSGIVLQMFGTDQSYNVDAADIAETRMGVDGKMVAGFTPVIHAVTITLEAASPSAASLATVWEAMTTNRCIYKCTLTATLPSIGVVITWSNGVLQNGAPVPAGQKVLGPTTWTFHFETMERAQLS